MVFRELPIAVEKEACSPKLTVVRSTAEFEEAYRAARAQLVGESDAGGPSDPSPVALPRIDFDRQVVLVREALDDQGVVWIVTQDGAITVGTQGCAGFGTGACRVQFFTLATTVGNAAASHSCGSIGCGGSPQITE